MNKREEIWRYGKSPKKKESEILGKFLPKLEIIIVKKVTLNKSK